MIQYANFKLIKGKTIPHERKQTFVKEIALPLYRLWILLSSYEGNTPLSVAETTSVIAWLNASSRTKAEIISNISRSTQIVKISLIAFFFKLYTINMIKYDVT